MLRSKIEILADVLEAARRGATRTRIMSKANLNQKLTDQTLRLLDDLELLTEKRSTTILYYTSSRGFQFLEEYSRLQKTLEE